MSYGYTLSTLVDCTSHLRQIRKGDLHIGDRIIVLTLNSVYSIRVEGGGYYSISGGWFDRKGLSPVKTTIMGCTWGGSAIKHDIIAACGLRLEFGNRLVTTTIRKVFVLLNGSQN